MSCEKMCREDNFYYQLQRQLLLWCSVEEMGVKGM